MIDLRPRALIAARTDDRRCCTSGRDISWRNASNTFVGNKHGTNFITGIDASDAITSATV